MAFVPVLNAAFQLFNMTYYARWYYMLTLMMSLATVAALQYTDVDWKRAVHWTLGITLGIALPIGLMPRSPDNGDGSSAPKKTVFGLEDYPTRFWAYVAMALLSLALLVIIFQYYKRNRQKVSPACARSALRSSPSSMLPISSPSAKRRATTPTTGSSPIRSTGKQDIKLPDSNQFSRIDVYDGMDNQAMFWQMPTIQAFHSIVPGSVMEFYPSIGVQRDVGSRPDVSVYGLRGLTSCRWLFSAGNVRQGFRRLTPGTTAMPGWSYYTTQNGCRIYQNDYYIPMGFSYDSYITRSEYNTVSEIDRHLLLLKAIVLENSDVSEILRHV